MSLFVVVVNCFWARCMPRGVTDDFVDVEFLEYVYKRLTAQTQNIAKSQ